MKKCVYAGTFDPPTVGHERVVRTGLEIFDEVVVAVMTNTRKTPLFTAEERAELLKELFRGEDRVKVLSFDGAAVDLLEAENTVFYLRGVRNSTDFEYETADYYASKKLKPDLIEIYIPAEQDELHISSTLVKNSVRFGKDYDGYIPEKIKDRLKRLLESKNV